MNKVFISYSSKDKKWVTGWLLPELESNGIQIHIDYRDFEIGVASLLNMERAVEQCAKTVLVLTPDYLESEFTQFEAILLQTQDPIGLRKSIIPLMLHDCQLPKRLNMLTYADFRQPDNHENEIIRVIGQIKKDFALLEEEPEKPAWPPLTEENVYIHRLPQTGYELFGRQEEIQLLNQAWESDKTNVVSFVAYGGMGKSTLINKWTERMRWDNYRGAQKVFAWSFYSQGTNEQVTSPDLFITTALEWFGDADPQQGSPWDKGKRLAQLIRQQKTLLLLDGMEPLQSTFEFEEGKIKDAALSTLVTELAKRNNGLCVITTREEVFEIKRYHETCRQISLEKISDEAGAALLRLLGIQGSDRELESATRDFGNHALAINLLGAYLHDIPGHHISEAAKIPDLDIPEEEGKHPRRILVAFAKRLSKEPEVELLHLFGLFNRPADLAAIDCIKAKPTIPGLTDSLSKLDNAAFLKTCDTLRHHKLIAQQSHHSPNTLDCHPLVREHFGEQLQKNNNKAWKEAHSRLYEYYKNLPEKELPDTLAEMEPLFAAVAHGCLAGRFKETMYNVFIRKIDRGTAFVAHKLGALGSALATISNFYEKPWVEPVSNLRESNKAYLLGITGFCLRALGRLREAAEPMQIGLKLRIEQKVWKNAAINAGNISELYLAMGDIQQAVKYARQSVEFADRSGDDFRKEVSRCKIADALHQAGKIDEAEKLFNEAEAMQQERQPEYRYLYSQRGFQFCDLLLSLGQVQEVLVRATETIEIAQRNNWLLDIALDKLSLGRSYFLQAQNIPLNPPSKGVRANVNVTESFAKAEQYLNQAVEGLRESGDQDMLPLALFSRAALYRVQKNFTAAWEDLNEAQEIAQRGEMGLHLADYHLEASRLSLAEDKRQMAEKHLDTAARMIKEMGYHRRDEEVKELKSQIAKPK